MLVLAAAAALVAAIPASFAAALVQPEVQGPCAPTCTWGYGFCIDSPYKYHCNNRGVLLWSKYRQGCNDHCWCLCTEVSGPGHDGSEQDTEAADPGDAKMI